VKTFKRCIILTNTFSFIVHRILSFKRKNSAPQKTPPPIVDVIVAQPQPFQIPLKRMELLWQMSS
jgi:hypothetical protein